MYSTERKLIIRRYLLGSVSEEQRNEFEAEYLTDDHLFEEVVAAENDLYDSYVSGALSESERRTFEKQFLVNPHAVERVRFAKALFTHSSARSLSRSATGVQEGAKESPPLPMHAGVQGQGARVLVAGMFLAAILAGGTWMVVRNRRINDQFWLVRNRQAAARWQQQAKSAAQVDEQEAVGDQKQENAERPSTNPGRVSLILSADLTRSGEQGKTLAIPRSISLVRLQLNLERDDYSSYGVLLETAEGKQIWHKNSLHAQPIYSQGKAVTVDLSSDILIQSDYVLSLAGVTHDGKTEEVCTYTFRVVRR